MFSISLSYKFSLTITRALWNLFYFFPNSISVEIFLDFVFIVKLNVNQKVCLINIIIKLSILNSILHDIF